MINYLPINRVNCSFYFKIGACRHGDKCVRIHNKPTTSQTLLIPHLYQNPPVAISIAEGNKVSDEALKEAIKHFEDFYEEVFIELSKYGEIKDLNVCDNLGDHLIGNVYVKYSSEEETKAALQSLTGRYYSGKPIVGEYSPVTDFRECRCKQYDDGSCGRGGFCNFMHLKYISKNFKKSLFDQMYSEHPEYKK
jgi:splicing factor U2AF subunit